MNDLWHMEWQHVFPIRGNFLILLLFVFMANQVPPQDLTSGLASQWVGDGFKWNQI